MHQSKNRRHTGHKNMVFSVVLGGNGAQAPMVTSCSNTTPHGEWQSSFLMAHQHNIGYAVPYC